MFRGVPLVLLARALGRGTRGRARRGRCSRWPTSTIPNVTAARHRQHRARRHLPRPRVLRARRHLDRLRRAPRLERHARRARRAGERPAVRHSLSTTRPGGPAWLTGGRVRPRGRPARHRSRSPSRFSSPRRWAAKGHDMTRAAVIGAGTMGNGIAHVFAQHGWDVALIDTCPAALEKATATIRANLDRQVKKGALPADAPAQVLGADRSRHRRSTPPAGADLVVEAASENPAVKFAALRAARPDRRARTRSSPPTPARSRSPRSPRAPGGPSR